MNFKYRVLMSIVAAAAGSLHCSSSGTEANDLRFDVPPCRGVDCACTNASECVGVERRCDDGLCVADPCVVEPSLCAATLGVDNVAIRACDVVLRQTHPRHLRITALDGVLVEHVQRRDKVAVSFASTQDASSGVRVATLRATSPVSSGSLSGALHIESARCTDINGQVVEAPNISLQ